jgi:hypothetical protein
MRNSFGRRSFIKGAVTAGFAAGIGPEEQILSTHLAQATDAQTKPATPKLELPSGKIKDLSISRLICGGNLIGGWAHSRDLIYVSKLFKAYNTDEKVLDTLELCEQNGVNTILTNPISGGQINKYWRERGGSIQWLSEVHPTPQDPEAGVSTAVNSGASMAYIQGNVGDRLVRDGHMETIAKTMEAIKRQGVPAGMGAHSLKTIIECEKAGVGAEFYVKTLHSNNYWSARRPDQNQEVVDNPADNYWCMDPEQTIEFMKTVEKPWIAFKVLAAGAIKPEEGFKYAFENGADIICVGMFDFQVADDAAIVKKTLDGLNRSRPWRA